MTPRYNIEVPLLGEDGNALAIMGAVTRAIKREMREDGSTGVEINAALDEYRQQAMSGDYDNLLRVTMEWVNVT